MPGFGGSYIYDEPIQARASSGAPTDGEISEASQNIIGTVRGTMSTLGGAVAFAVPDLVDTVGSSIGISDRGDFNDRILRAVDMPGLTRFHRDVQPSTEIASGVVGVIGAELAARRITAPASVVMRGLRALPYARRLAQMDEAYATAMLTVRGVDRQLAVNGALGMEQFAGQALINGQIVNRAGAVSRARWLGAGVAARNAAVTEGIAFTTLNTNSALYTDSTASNMAFAALGIALPAGVEAIHATYLMRRAASDSTLVAEQIRSMDPRGLEETRLNWMQSNTGAGAELNPFGGRTTDEVTSLLLEAQTLRSGAIPEGADARQLLGNRDLLRTQKLQLARERVASVTSRGLSHDGRTAFTIGTGTGDGRVAGAQGYANHVNDAINRDPTVMYLVEQVGGVPDTLPADVVVSQWRERTAERIKDVEDLIAHPDTPAESLGKLRLDRLKLAEEAKQTPMVLIDGERLPMSEASVIENFEAPTLQHYEYTPDANRLPPGQRAKGPLGSWSIRRPTMKSTVASIDNDLNLVIHGQRDLANLDHHDYLRLYRLGDKVARELATSGETIRLAEDASWFQLDLAEEILQRSNGHATVVFPRGMTRESAQVESFAQKAELMDKKEAARLVSGTPSMDREVEMARLRVQLNMPRTTAYEMGVTGSSESPALSLLRGAGRYGPDKIRQMSLTDLKTTVAEWQRLGDMAPITARDVDRVSGKSFTYMLDSDGQEMKPIIMMLRPAKPFEWIADNVVERVANQQLVKRNIMMNQDADELSKLVTTMLYDNPDAIKAAATHELRETQLMGALTGSSPMSTRGAASNAVVTSEFRDRDAPVLLAAGRVRDTVDRLTSSYVTQRFAAAFGSTLNELANPRNTQSVLLLDQFHSFASGWDLLPKPGRENGFNVFKLADNAANRDRYLRQYGHAMPANANLTSPTGTTVVLDDLALQAQTAFNQVSTSLVDAKNTLLRSMGMREIRTRPWFVPTPNTKGKHIGFVYGPDRREVPGMSIIADTQQEYARKAAAMGPELDRLGLGYTLRSLDDIQKFGNIWDRSIAEMLDPGTTAIQPGKKATGALTERLTRVGAFTDALDNVRGQFLQHGRDVLETQFDSSIKAAEARANIAQASRPRGNRLFNEANYKSAHDIYLENLLGKSKVKDDSSFVGKLYNGVEGTIDKLLENATPTASRVWDATTMWFNRAVPFSSGKGAARDFESLTKHLGRYMPFEDAAQMIEAKGFGAKPWTSQEMAGKMNQFAAATLLRVADAAHAVINLGGIVTTMPSVVRFMSRRTGETVEQHLARIGHLGMVFDSGGGNPVGVLDMTKVLKRGLAAALDPKNHSLYDDFVARGMLSQEVAELHKQYGLIDGRGPWKRFFFGDPSIANPKGVAARLRSKGAVGWLSVMTDKSEDFTRTVATMTGHELAVSMGVTSKEGRLSFAHDFANKAIANYSPQNRAEVFQGALGTSIGLFQSYMQNYYQRMFRYVETKDWSSLATAYGTQGAMFGIASVPGFSTISWMREQTSENGDNSVSDLRQRFGGAADLFEGGALANLPTLFGAEAVDFYSRGNANIRIPGGPLFTDPQDKSAVRQIAELAPAMGIVTKIWDGISEGAGLFSSRNPQLSTTQVGEVLAHAIANRPIAGAIEQFMGGGAHTDRYGQLVSQTNGAMEAIYRVMGVRSMRQSQEIEAFYANKGSMEHKAGLDAQLRTSMRALMREGRFDEFYDVFQTQYIQNGGDPRYFRRTVKDNMEAATSTRGQRQLESALNNPARAAEVQRLLDAGVISDTSDRTDAEGGEFDSSFVGPEQTEGPGEYPEQLSYPDLSRPQ